MTTDEPVLACIWFKIQCDCCGMRYEQVRKLGYGDVGTTLKLTFGELVYGAYRWAPRICGACGSFDILVGVSGAELNGKYQDRTSTERRQNQADRDA